MVRDHGIPFHEKKLGQLFCDHSAQAIVGMLDSESRQAGAEIRLDCRILDVRRSETPPPFEVETSAGVLRSQSLVIATGGALPAQVGATDLGYRIARQFGLKITELAPRWTGLSSARRSCGISAGSPGFPRITSSAAAGRPSGRAYSLHACGA